MIRLFAVLLLLCTSPSYAEMYTMKVTGFVAKHNERTSLMTKPKIGYSVAVSRDKLHLLGKRVYIEDLGVRRVESVMARRIDNTIDVLVPSKKEAKKIGNKHRRVVIL